MTKDPDLDPRLAAVNLHERADFDYGQILPLDIWLAVLNAPIPAKAPIDKQTEMLDEKLKICKEAAPYIHPKLMAVDARIQGDVTLTVVTGVPDRVGFDPGQAVVPPSTIDAPDRHLPIAKTRMDNLKQDMSQRLAIHGRKRTPEQVAETSRELENAMDTVEFD